MGPGVTTHRFSASGILLAILSCLLLPACESGWDIDGRVITRDVSDRSRSIHVLLVTAETLEVERILAADPAYGIFELASAARIPAEGVSFEHHAFGCHDGEVAIVAWAPVSEPPDSYGFMPASGDLVAVSRIASPYCGSFSDVEHYELELTDEPLP
jgi:hypothetical protein